MMKELRTEIEIQATPEMVWQVLTDFDRYPEWNPFIPQAIGKAQVGAKVDISIQSGSKERMLHCPVIKAEPNKELCWKYHVVLPFLFNGEHRFLIEKIDNSSVRFIDQEVFKGLLVVTQAKDIDTQTKRGFEALDRALKARVEQN